MPEHRCLHCGPAPDVELRPYGPGGALVCFPCATASPEREAQTKAAFAALLDANAAVSPSGVVAIDAPDRPIDDLWALVWHRLGNARPRTKETTNG